MIKVKLFKLVLGGMLLWGSHAAYAQAPQVVIEGLRSPQDLLLTPGGNFLVTEPDTAINNGRISYVTRNGDRRSLFEGLPSGTDVTGSASGPTAMALRNRTLYLTIGGGDVETPTEGGPAQHSPDGISSPLFSSVLSIQFSADVDALTGTFTMTPAIQERLGDGFEVVIDNGAGATARVLMLADFPNSMPDPNMPYRFSNPWGIAVSPDGSTLMVADASMDALIRVNATTGRWQRVVKFPPTANPTPIGPPMVDTVPTSVSYYGNDVLITTLTGFPFATGVARTFLVNGSTGAVTPFISSLTTSTDLAVLPRAGQRPVFFTAEFSLAMLSEQPAPGRILRFDTPAPTLVSAGVPAPVSLQVDANSGSLFVLSLIGTIFEFDI